MGWYRGPMLPGKCVRCGEGELAAGSATRGYPVSLEEENRYIITCPPCAADLMRDNGGMSEDEIRRDMGDNYPG